MAMSFAGAGASAVPGANARTVNGDELQEIAVETLNFKTLGGNKNIKLLPQSWPLNDLPASTSSLLSISSKQGLLAAAGPSTLVLARTKAVRDAFTAQAQEVAQDVKDFKPALTIDVPKLSQVAFTADGTYLVVCAHEGGGLGVYETQAILQDKKETAFQLPTHNISVRALSPNPAPEFSHLVAVILTDGKLLVADLRNRDFIKNGSGSPALKEGVAAVSWSNRGKQLTAGMADGNCFQLDQSGTVKASIPAPSDLPAPCHVSSLVWLANDEWLIYHTPNAADDPDRPPESILHHVQSDKERTHFVFRKPAIEPVGNWGMNRVPLTHYISRLRNWYNIKDWLIVSSVVSTEVAMLTSTAIPLNNETPVVGSYSVTAFSNDSSRISIPLSVTGETDTTLIGMALDLSSTDKVLQPIPGDEMDESPFPLPAVMLLNNEGVLISSWVIYNDALRNNQPCPDMLSSQPAGQVTSPQTPQTSTFGASIVSPATSAFNGFAKPALPTFGQQSAFGNAGAAPAFGGASQIGNKQSPWGTAAGSAAKPAGAVFGQSSMGAGKPAFGSTSTFGAAAASGAPAFGATASKPAVSPWGTPAANSAASKPASGGFSSYGGSTASPFGAMASTQSAFAQQVKPTQSAFAESGTTTGSTPAASFGMSSQPSFGSTVSVDTSTGGSTLGGKSVFGTPAHAGGIFNKPSLTPAETQESDMMDDGGEKVATPKEDKPAGLFGLPVGEFKLGSTFTPGNKDDKSDTEEEKPKDEARPRPLFGADFGAALGDAQKEREKTASPQIKKEPEEDKPSIFGIPAVTKEEGKPKPSLFGSATTTTPAKSTLSFGKPSPTPSTLRLDPEPPQVTSKPAPSPSTTTAPSNDSKDSSKESKDGSEASGPLAGDEAEAIEMPESDDDDLAKEPEEEVEDAPLPPDPSTIKVSKDFYLQNLPGEKTAPKAPSPLRPQKQLTTGPLLFGEKISTTPSGFPKAPQMFAPPVPASREMPRSPSPVRSASTPAGKLFSKPPSRPTSTRPQFTPPVLPQQKAPAEPIATPASLQDKEAEQNRAILESSIQPTLDLAPYITHQDYVGPHSKAEGTVSAQIETLFCDINAMVDTLGLNARALNEFVEGHNSLMPDRGRSREDLENTDGDEGWCLVEVDELMQIERGLGDEIESVRVGDREAKVAEVYGMRRELVRVKNSLREVRRFIEAAKDEERAEQRRRAPLDGNSEARQRAVRRDMAKFLKALAEAEDAVSLLKVRLANVLGKQGRSGPVPTVEAVEKTVRKMTQWAEEKGADMDVLEARMKKLGLVGPSQSGLRSSQSGLRRSGLFSTPSPRKSPKKMSTFAVPEESESEGEEGFVDVDPRQEAVRELVETRKKKSVVMGRIKDAIRRRGLKVTEG